MALIGQKSAWRDAIERNRRKWFERRMARVAGDDWTTLHARQVFILPTRAGLGFAGLLLVLLLGAINYGNNLIFALTFLLAGLAFVAMVHTYRSLVRLEIKSGRGQPGFVGDSIDFQLWLRPGDGRARVGIELAHGDGSRAIVDVTAEGSLIRLYRVGTRRGRLALGTVTIATRFPLGLFRAWSYLDVAHAEPVYPAPAPPGGPPPESASPGCGGRVAAGAGTDDFAGLRAYHTGDSLRHIDWKAWAREQGMLTKQFAAGMPPEDWLDFAAAPDVETEARLSRLCRWLLDAEHAHRRYALRLPGLVIEPGQGDVHRDRCLSALADFESTS